jgi:hypothetical protein
VVESHDELPERHLAEYRLRGMDPDTVWSLLYSFTTQEAAERTAAECQAQHLEFCRGFPCEPWKTYRVRDLGGEQEIERESWF